MQDRGLAWEMIKLKIRAFSVPYCVKKKRDRQAFKKNLENELKKLQEEIDASPTQLNQDLYALNKKELEQIEKEEMNSHIFKTKLKWIEEGEKNSKFFLSLEKNNYTNKLISTLEVNGKFIKDPTVISESQTDFYKNLYSERLNEQNDNYQDSFHEFLNNNEMLKLNNDEKTFYDKPICEADILKSIKNLPSGKTPGSDGLPADFYKCFWCDIKRSFTQCIIYVMEKGELTIEQKRGIITLLPKKGKNRLFLKNWRPITLLNTDYKVIAKILAMRLQLVQPNIINDDQPKGCYIGQNIKILEDFLFFTKENELPGILLSIDFEKAFDSLNWNILYKTLAHMNFGDNFIGYVKTMYNNIESTILNNGNTGIYFRLHRGVSQVCPLSAYLYINHLRNFSK